MPLDIKFLEESNGYLVGSMWPNPDQVEGSYSLGQLITKCLLTNPGDDAFDPAYGAGLKRALQGIPGQHVDEATQAITAVVEKVKADLASTRSSSDAEERLSDLRLISVAYDIDSTAWLIELLVVSDATEFPLSLPTG